ncbi:MBL fold metallo-hydrolase [Thermogladius sp. 4427co]|uniref:MBL fold metallo-hydrolase n=1 Tax=Thermogladius sp. 4427co TaxID=3450718 RepID=UPI003F7B241F
MLVDNHGDPEGRLGSPWGLSILVVLGGYRVLFDTGPDPEALLGNARILGIDLSRVDAVVISHEHGDHTGGLEALARVNKSIPVYIPGGSSRYFKEWVRGLGFERVVEVPNTTFISPGIAVVGQLYGPPYEEALAVRIPGYGLVVLVGCSHPGIENIARKASRDLGERVYAVVGGFHMIGYSRSEVEEVFKDLKSLGARIVIPLHCSGDTARELARELFGFDEQKTGHVGSVIILP